MIAKKISALRIRFVLSDNISHRNSLHRILPTQGPDKCPNRQEGPLPQVDQLDWEQTPLYPYTSRFPSLITTCMIFMRTVRDSRNRTRVIEVHPVPIDLFSDCLSDFCRATGGDNMMGAVDRKSLCLDTIISSATTIHLIQSPSYPAPSTPSVCCQRVDIFRPPDLGSMRRADTPAYRAGRLS